MLKNLTVILLSAITLLLPGFATSSTPISSLVGSTATINWTTGGYDSIVFTTPDFFYSLTGQNAGESGQFAIFNIGVPSTGLDTDPNFDPVHAFFNVTNTGESTIANIVINLAPGVVFAPPDYGTQAVNPSTVTSNYTAVLISSSYFPDSLTVSPTTMQLAWSGGFSASGFGWQVDTIASVATVPEPSTYLMLGTFLMMGLALRCYRLRAS